MSNYFANQYNKMMKTNKNNRRRSAFLMMLAVIVAAGTVTGVRFTGVAFSHKDKVLTCSIAESGTPVAHKHNNDCYNADGVLVCTLPEIEAHTHSAECFDEEENLICGQQELPYHDHGDACFTAMDVEDKLEYEVKAAAEAEQIEEQAAAAEEAAAQAEENAPAAEAEEAIEESSAAEAEQPAVTEHSFQAAAGGINVSVTAPAEAFPAGTTMVVTPVYDESILDKAAGMVNDTVKSVQAVDITFYNAEGKEIEPAAPITVNMTSAAIAESENSVIVHMADNGDANVVDGASEGDTVTFESDSFSVYVIVGTELVTEWTLSNPDGKDVTYLVKVTYGPEANIPDGSTLSVTNIKEDTEEYETAKKAVLADKENRGEEVALAEFGFAAVDISILNPEGKEIEPAAPVKVEFRIKSLPEVENLDDVVDSLEIQHHVETGSKVVVDTVYTGGSANASFDVATDKEVIAEGKAVDPAAYELTENTEIFEDDDVIDTEFEVEAFSTYSISFYYNYYSRNIHYVDTNGRSLTPSMTPNFNARYQYLIYDIEGYEYDSTHLRSRTGTAIQPILRSSSSSGLYYSGNIQYLNGNNWSNLNDDVYVVYKAKEVPATGGTPQVDQTEEWPEGNDTPQFGKSSTNNGNGTNTISLSISAGEKPVVKSTPADVIVVFDVSGSMKESMGGQTRLARAKTAVKNMADTLLNGSNNDVRMALISFSTTAAKVPATGEIFTDSYRTFSSRVDNLNADGGTNWEQALELANTIEVREDAATFIVFVTDGDPTFRVSRGNVSDNSLDLFSSSTYQYYRANAVFGEGNNDTYGRNFDFAVEQVSAIASANKSFYAIGISNDVTKVQNLTTEGGVAADHAFIASDNAAMERAFKSITESIKSVLGFGNVEVTDGITALTNAEMKVMQTVDPASFTYYRYGGENNKYGRDYEHKTVWTTREADGCAAAGYNEAEGAVEWNMGAGFQLEDGVTYVVEFIVWPSQAAYDLVADLNNGIRTYASLTAEEKAQVVEVAAPTGTTTGTYALKTNTNEVNATYNKTSKSGSVVSVSDETVLTATYHEGLLQNMGLTADYITVVKEWNNELDGRAASGVDLTVTKDGAAYLTGITVDADNNWTSGKEYISAGFITRAAGGRYNVRETGHDYTVTEPVPFSYYWDLSANVYRPMVIDGTLHVLIKTGSPSGAEGTDYFMINGSAYQVRDGQNTLTATNDRRSVLDLAKTISLEEGAADIPEADVLFTYTITITDVTGADVWFSAMDKNGAMVEISSTSANVVAEMSGEELTGYYYVPSGQQFTISMKADWNVRFINLPTGTTYTIQETGKGEAEGYAFDSAAASADNGGTAATVNGDTVNGTIDKPNNIFTVGYTNRWLTKEIEIVKVDENGRNLAGASFVLTKGHDAITEFTSNAAAGEIIALGKGTYCLTETSAPDGYIILTNKIYFNVYPDGTVELCGEEGNTEMVTEDGETAPVEYSNASVTNPPSAARGTVTVRNERGAALPNTGGTGTTVIYAVGIIVVAAALVMLITKKRMQKAAC
ncbi:MAG: VWA domain-containing protein [Eubacterium sp.]|nr:VWA domain-containing protein [Eubacterium sp.]